ncbi:MAG TPA: hypothetical protein VLA05_03060 [Coriobacteriia bacterium]|nr:hypothetical protein [Coriobacteriia bacterium]
MRQGLTGLAVGLVIGSVVAGSVAIANDRPVTQPVRLQAMTRSVTATACVDPDHVQKRDGNEKAHEALTSTTHKRKATAKKHSARRHENERREVEQVHQNRQAPDGVRTLESAQHRESSRAASDDSDHDPSYDGHSGNHDGEHHE